MRALLISDLHLAVKLPHARLNGDKTSSDRLLDVLDVLEQVEETCLAEGIDQVFVLGDLFDMSNPDMATLRAAAEALRKLAKVATVNVLPGNHDAHDRRGELYTLALFDALRFPGLVIWKRGVAHRANGVTFFALPWLPDKLAAAVVKDFALEPGRRNVLLCHQTISGARELGHSLSSPLGPGDLDGFELVVSGHIHEPQAFANVQYLGAPLALRFGDVGERGFWLFDTDGLSLTFRPVKAPRFVLFAPAAELLREQFAANVRTFVARTLSEGDAYLDVRLAGPRADVDSAAATVAAVLASEDRPGLRFVRVSRSYSDRVADRFLSASASGGIPTDGELVRRVVEAAGKLPDGVSREALIELGCTALEVAE